ncbi:MAG: phosphoribosylaminoimidazolecarboxamide formyltransferase [SAR324 cluster bacterium]|nr:phosphoribosylaminoimidazolecarboxamide formyltransferase [SAR324 cluster bacterium]
MSTSITRFFHHQFDLKYGCNPHQNPAAIYSLQNRELPFEVLNGKPGYINLLDAMNSWQLVQELDKTADLPAAASFKHVSPAGAAVAVPLDDTLKQVYECSQQELSDLATAYIRARGADPMSSFGDFIALSRTVDTATAQIIKPAVSDGIIAPDYAPEALEILKAKKKGSYVILKVNPGYLAPDMEYREVFGVGFAQKSNDLVLGEDNLFQHIPTEIKDMPTDAKRNLILAAVTLKYTQSNSVGYALDGQMIGIGAGQQSRIDCTKLAGKKAENWFLRQHPKVLGLPFKSEIKRVERTNARVCYIEGDMTAREMDAWQQNFNSVPPALTDEEKSSWLEKMSRVCLASDAFFPFRDNIDQASKRGVSYIVQPGGSVRDDDVIQAANDYGMVMAFSKIRLFHH